MTDAMNPILFRDLRDVLDANRGGVGNGDDQRTLRIDPNRRLRTGIPEVIYAASKPPQAVAESLKQLATANGRALASRVAEDTVTTLRTLLEPTFEVEIFSLARACSVDPRSSAGHFGRRGRHPFCRNFRFAGGQPEAP